MLQMTMKTIFLGRANLMWMLTFRAWKCKAHIWKKRSLPRVELKMWELDQNTSRQIWQLRPISVGLSEDRSHMKNSLVTVVTAEAVQILGPEKSHRASLPLDWPAGRTELAGVVLARLGMHNPQLCSTLTPPPTQWQPSSLRSKDGLSKPKSDLIWVQRVC